MVNFSYLVFQYNYCLITKEIVYAGIDWNNDAINSTKKALLTVIITVAFFLMVLLAQTIKFYLNGVDRKIVKSKMVKNI